MNPGQSPLIPRNPSRDCDNVASDSRYFTGVRSNKWKHVKPYIRPSQHDVRNLYDALLFDKIVTEAWKHIAQALIPLCRGKPAGTFHLPSSLFPEDGGLPGYTEGNTPLPKDPTCSPPTCTLEL
ncbi:hypothetical protein AAMO2058_000027100 [Amorphochlora amoebiformis]